MVFTERFHDIWRWGFTVTQKNDAIPILDGRLSTNTIAVPCVFCHSQVKRCCQRKDTAEHELEATDAAQSKTYRVVLRRRAVEIQRCVDVCAQILYIMFKSIVLIVCDLEQLFFISTHTFCLLSSSCCCSSSRTCVTETCAVDRGACQARLEWRTHLLSGKISD